MSTKIAFWPSRCVLNRLQPAPDEVAAARPRRRERIAGDLADHAGQAHDREGRQNRSCLWVAR